MVTVRWKHSPSEKEWLVSGPSSQGFVVLNRPPHSSCGKQISGTCTIIFLRRVCCLLCIPGTSREVPQRTASCKADKEDTPVTALVVHFPDLIDRKIPTEVC
jgi:hypothetical protein